MSEIPKNYKLTAVEIRHGDMSDWYFYKGVIPVSGGKENKFESIAKNALMALAGVVGFAVIAAAYQISVKYPDILSKDAQERNQILREAGAEVKSSVEENAGEEAGGAAVEGALSRSEAAKNALRNLAKLEPKGIEIEERDASPNMVE